ncbi:MAG: hypothetical protein CM15mP49_14520 [Actinomycetota bacterium]|nr:MAG: hypothetical protein CM15mP49_14520 [Actinomycetota bacterium]
MGTLSGGGTEVISIGQIVFLEPNLELVSLSVITVLLKQGFT